MAQSGPRLRYMNPTLLVRSDFSPFVVTDRSGSLHRQLTILLGQAAIVPGTCSSLMHDDIGGDRQAGTAHASQKVVCCLYEACLLNADIEPQQRRFDLWRPPTTLACGIPLKA